MVFFSAEHHSGVMRGVVMATLHIGIDIGTTNITLMAVSLDAQEVPSCTSRPNRRIDTGEPYAYAQDPHAIELAVRELMGELKEPIASICVTGQVHGILYYDRSGAAVSPLYTWLDQRAMEVFDNQSSQQALFEQSGWHLPSGYGLLAHYANRRLGKVPQNAAGFCGIIEYITSRLIGTTLSAADPSCLGTYGGFNPVTETFDRGLLNEVLGASDAPFLSASHPFAIAGETPDGVPVVYGVGDNQAGFFGMVSSWQQSALISIGTSGQISLFSRSSDCPSTMELRPFLGEGYLHVGATLTAGKAYETMHTLFTEIIRSSGVEIEDETVFALMKEAAQSTGESSLTVDPRFTGSRVDPAVRGSITNITLDNLSMGEFVLATIDGIVDELRAFGRDAEDTMKAHQSIIATGSAIRKNHLFRQALAQQFNLPAITAEIDDGAGFGAALIGAVGVGALSLNDRGPLIHRLLGT